jgi:cytochrome c-type biogenesis protein CcmF
VRPATAAPATRPSAIVAALEYATSRTATVVGKPDGQGLWQLRLWWKPFVTLIWLGGVLIALGGALALVILAVLIGSRRRRARRPG